ncbi:DNA-directed RNA polymerase subunit E'' [Candidatus Woesearchaeota archaeon]|nr:DNA-directed RNA polymerase subunit E'' [Candidatus Woesearchaeota archaeon]
MAKEKVCAKCKIYIPEGDVCPICKKTNYATVAYGKLIVIDPEKSFLAKKAGAPIKGVYALKVR